VKARVHLRIAKGPRGARVAATAKPNLHPLYDSQGVNSKPLPTVSFAVDLNIPDELFKQAEHVIAEIDVTGEKAKIAAQVREV
jgi:hypothetical protein